MAASSDPPPAGNRRLDTSTRALLAECAATRERACAAKEKMRLTLSSARADLQKARNELAAAKAYMQALLER